MPTDRQHPVGHDADALRRSAEETHELGRFAAGIGQHQVGQSRAASTASSECPAEPTGAPSPPGRPTLRIRSGSSAAIARGSYQQIGESTTGTPRALATRASSSPSRDIPNRCSSRAFSSRSVHARKQPDRNTQLFKVPARLDQLVLAPARRLKGKRRRVQDARHPGAARAAAVGLQPLGGRSRRSSEAVAAQRVMSKPPLA